MSLSISKLGKRVRQTISRYSSKREPITLTVSPPESEEESPHNTPSLTIIRAPKTSSPAGRPTPVLDLSQVSPISQISGVSIFDVSEEIESDCE